MKYEKLIELAAPLSAWLRENCNPHCAAIVTDDGVKLVSDEMFVPLTDTPVVMDLVETSEG